MPNFFDKEKYVLYYENLQLDLRLGLKLNIYIYIYIYIYIFCRINTQKRTKAEKNRDNKALRKSINNTVYGKTMENLRDRIDVRLASNKKDYLK